MKLPGREMAGGVVPAGGFRFFVFCAPPRPGPSRTRDPPATHLASSVCPIQVDRPGTRETVPEAVAPLQTIENNDFSRNGAT